MQKKKNTLKETSYNKPNNFSFTMTYKILIMISKKIDGKASK